MSSVIEVKDLSFKYNQAKKAAIKKINFSVEEGEFLCIIGPNGSGKSTLCNALVGLVPHYFTGKTKGSVSIMGQDTVESSVALLASKIGLVFQNPFNQLSYTTSTVEEELAYGLCNLGVPREDMKSRVQKIAKTMRIEHLINKNPLALSGGQVQRVAIGSSLIMEPSILVLDECTTQLDPLGSEEIFDIVTDLKKNGITVVMVDHDMERVARCADRILVMHEGKALAHDTPRNIFGDSTLNDLNVDRPDFSRISMAMQQEGMYNGELLIMQNETVEAIKEVTSV